MSLKMRIELTFSHCRRNGEPLSPQQITEAEQYALDVMSGIAEDVEMERSAYGACSGLWAFTDSVDGHVEALWDLTQMIAIVLDPESVMLDIVAVNGTVGSFRPQG